MWADSYDLAGLGDPMTAEQIQMLKANYSPEDVAKILAQQGSSGDIAKVLAQQGSSGDSVAVAPTTEAQVINLINTVAKGLLEVQQTNAQTKLSTAQIANAEASKVQAQNYVMQQLQQGKQVMVPQSWLQAYTSSGTLTKWLTPILIIGGVALLGYAAYRYTKKGGRSSLTERGSGVGSTASLSEAGAAMSASNPRHRRRRKHRR